MDKAKDKARDNAKDKTGDVRLDLSMAKDQLYLFKRFFSILKSLSPKLAYFLPLVIVLSGTAVYVQSFAISWMVKSVYDAGTVSANNAVNYLPVAVTISVAIILQMLNKLQKYMSSLAEWYYRTEFETLTPKIYTSLGLEAYAKEGEAAQGLARSDDAVYDARFFMPRMFESLVAFGSASIGFIIIVSISWVSGLILLVPLAISCWIQLDNTIRFIKSERNFWRHQTSITNVRKSFGSFHNFVAYRAFGMNNYLLNFISKLAITIRDNRFQILLKERNGSWLSQSILFPSLLIALWFPFKALTEGTLDPKNFVFLLLSVIGFSREIQNTVSVFARQILMADKMLLLLKVFDMKKPVPAKKVNHELPKTEKPVLAVQDLHFAYPDSEPVFQGLNAEIEILPISYFMVGENGVGKSTFLGLLTEIFEPQSGSVNICNGGVMKKALLVPQSGVKVDITVRNLLQASSMNEETDQNMDDEYIQILRDAGVWDDLEKMKGLNTLMGLRGGMSGGQEQRVFLSLGLACMHFRKKELGAIILDEPFNHLSPSGMNATIRNFKGAAMANGVPLIIVSHFKQLIMDDSRILFLYKNGEEVILTEGLHGSLSETCPAYSYYWSKGQNSHLEQVSN